MSKLKTRLIAMAVGMCTATAAMFVTFVTPAGAAEHTAADNATASGPVSREGATQNRQNRGYFVASVHSGKCLDDAGWSTDNGAPIIQWDCHGGANQQWAIGGYSDGSWDFHNMHSGKCLDVPGWSTVNGAQLIQWDCHGGANQRWWPYQYSDGSWLLQNVHSGKCLDVSGWSTDNGAPIIQWDCHGGANQRWWVF